MRTIPVDIKNVGISVIVGVISATAGAGATIGSYSNRLDNAEQLILEQRKAIASHEVALARNEVQYAEILRRLDRIDNAVRSKP